MQELMPLLSPPAPGVLQPAGLQRFRQYFDAITEALQVLQFKAVTAQGSGQSVATLADCFDWTALEPASAGVLMLAVKLCQQVAPAVCCEVISGHDWTAEDSWLHLYSKHLKGYVKPRFHK